VTNRQNEEYLEKKEFNETENEIDIRGMDEMGKRNKTRENFQDQTSQKKVILVKRKILPKIEILLDKKQDRSF